MCDLLRPTLYKHSWLYRGGDFNHDEFYSYAEHLARQGYKVFISEYEMPKDRFKSVFFVEKRQTLNGKDAGAIKQEHLFVPLAAKKKQVICA